MEGLYNTASRKVTFQGTLPSNLAFPDTYVEGQTMDSKKMRALLRAQPDGHSPRTGNIAHLINQSDEVAAHAKEAIASAESLTRRTRRLLATLGIGWTEPSRISAQNLWD